MQERQLGCCSERGGLDMRALTLLLSRMCGRYRLKRADAKAISDQLGIPLNVVLAYVKDVNGDRWNIAPREKTPPAIVYKPDAAGPVTLADSLPWGITL